MELNSTKEHFKLVKQGIDLVIFEGGWWMESDDYLSLQLAPEEWIIDKNDKTHQLTLCLKP